MKNLKSSPTYHSQKAAYELSAKIEFLLEEDLADPRIANQARLLLNAVRKQGYRFYDPALEDPDCLSCLHLSLMDAAEEIANSSRLH